MTNTQKEAYEDTDVLRETLSRLKGRKFKLDCGHYAQSIVMRSPQLADPAVCHIG